MLVLISSLVIPTAFCMEAEDSQIFIAGFNSYQLKDYSSAIEKMNEVLQKYPETPLRDMVLFWLSRSYFKVGNQRDAALHFSRFLKEYPDNPLEGTVEEELLSLAARHDKGEKLSAGTLPAKQSDQQVAKKSDGDQGRIASPQVDVAEVARLTALKQAEEKAAAEKKERERLAVAKVEEERIALETETRRKAEQERVAALKAEEARKNSEKREQDGIAAARAEEAKKGAAVAADSARLAAVRNEEQRLVALKAAQERLEAEKAAKQKLAAEKAEQQALLKAEEARMAAAESARMSALRAEETRKASEKASIDAEAIRQAEEQRLVRLRVAEEKKAEKAALREKAIAQYKSIIEKYSSSAAAVTAATKLRELGVAVALRPKVAAPEILPENAQILSLEVAQFAGFEFNLQAPPAAYKVAKRVSVPFEIINRGNGNDSFYLESGFPTAFNSSFAAVSSPEVAINQTSAIAPGETFKGFLNLTVPAGSIDGLRITHPVKAASRFMAEASQSREVALTASAPLLRAVLKTDKVHPLPGEKIVYRVTVLNVGSTIAEDITLRIDFPPQMEPMDYAASGFRHEMKSALVFDGLKINSGESREFSVVFQLQEGSLAGQELLARAELINNQLKTTNAFVSNMMFVQPQRGILVRSGSERILVIPGQTISVPFVVTNTGNVREKFRIALNTKGSQDAAIFHDVNRDGIRQASSEPAISEIGPLAPREEASVVMEVKTPKSAGDGSEGSVTVSFSSEGDAARSATGLAQLVYSRPVLQMVMAGRTGRLQPGEVASFDMTITNKGSNLARVVELQSAWPEQLDLVAAEPANSVFNNGNMIWRFKEVGASEKRIIKVSFRVKQGTGVGTSLQVKNIMTYEDQLGNRY